jgi:hypothetical protein
MLRDDVANQSAPRGSGAVHVPPAGAATHFTTPLIGPDDSSAFHANARNNRGL